MTERDELLRLARRIESWMIDHAQNGEGAIFDLDIADQPSVINALRSLATQSPSPDAGLRETLEKFSETIDDISPSEEIGVFDGSGRWAALMTVGDLRALALARANQSDVEACGGYSQASRHHSGDPQPSTSDPSDITYRIGRWLSAALDDPKVCHEMKADILAWMEAGKPNVQPSDTLPDWKQDQAETTRIKPRPSDPIPADAILAAGLVTDETAIRADERERCAQIAEGNVYKEKYRTWPWWNGGNRSNESDFVKHADAIAAAIRNGGER